MNSSVISQTHLSETYFVSHTFELG